ncbi:MAG: hypothetical protein A3J65_01060 [Candidatus Buchananbacteria bacterium RIFCSPHIGHO2_02_FULL_45_11b]|uniref:DJ-1/PfpI domain-containing protein n=4 Tax=Candidatus Buchananiibacteriota TaxID=1817903 RepID=A0A1G1Y5S5_9BACT|nr:MAG: hypothetical protein A2663_03570 [Candidatus Buchananbacteria bacterium RIFCSPHIGHO2_01_FULL_46_12]OGY52109.1 MAG: hypothetical protein A3J65_01060 [Candidatus Buchananbacteria bacterium RIFCSPHIGHO2_02_FULL_45_11b]OGY53932.1 MAG: hypothetical protein A3B15_02670 [Candidatus Buchananbacteria bacterium RIFCSPLOWO2_01_FULL_45_31]OGY57971.1 MAG: hypothetical protein A3H67_01985 [Candidatus Buchananbacteria bacterium RIFCSPLOWO2_02_FULL_46_11b]
MPKKALFIVAQKNFRDEEFLIPKEILEKRGIKTAAAAKAKSPALGKLGAEVMPDLALAEVQAKDFDAVIFVGGTGARDYYDDLEALKIARDFKAAGKILAAICAGPSILANAGVLIGKTATGFPSEEENIKSKGAFYTGMQVEVDGLVVTAKDPSAAREFGEKLAYLLEE